MTENRAKILIGVHGRFHAFDLAYALGQIQGVDVHLVTNYPRRVISQWVTPKELDTFVSHGICTRFVSRLGERFQALAEPVLHTAFGKFIRHAVRKKKLEYDLTHIFTGVAEESLVLPNMGLRTLMRGSAHIAEQDRLLEEESQRVDKRIERPSKWMIAREQREYAIAEKIVVLSNFAYRSFVEAGFNAERLELIPLGVNTQQFIATNAQRDARVRRVREGQKLKVLLTGTLSTQKGASDFLAVAKRFNGEVSFTVVGNVTNDANDVIRNSEGLIELKPRVPQSDLPKVYAEYDVFLFPTIHDGFAAVLAQACAAGLAVIATENCGAYEVLKGSPRGWIVPIRSVDAICERLNWLQENREAMAQLLLKDVTLPHRDWEDVANDFVRLAEKRRIETVQ